MEYVLSPAVKTLLDEWIYPRGEEPDAVGQKTAAFE